MSLENGCGSVGRVVTPNTRDPWFESSHWQNLSCTKFTINCIEKTKIKEKQAPDDPKKNILSVMSRSADFRHSDWLLIFFNQSECLKNKGSVKFTLKPFLVQAHSM